MMGALHPVLTMRYIAYQRRGSEVESKLSFLEKIKNSYWKYENLDSNLVDGETQFFFLAVAYYVKEAGNVRTVWRWRLTYFVF